MHFGTSSVKGLRAGGRVRGRQLGTVEFSRGKKRKEQEGDLRVRAKNRV